MASAEVNVALDCIDGREKDDHHIRLCLESGDLFSSLFSLSPIVYARYLSIVGDARVD